MANSKDNFEQGSANVEQHLFDKIMKQEKYDCKNPTLLKALKDTGSLDIGFPAEAAEVLGKCLQYLMKQRKETKVSEQTLDDAIKMIDKFDKTDAGDAINFARDNVIRILSATWSKGDQIAIGLGNMSKANYEAFYRALVRKYVSPLPGHTVVSERK